MVFGNLRGSASLQVPFSGGTHPVLAESIQRSLAVEASQTELFIIALVFMFLAMSFIVAIVYVLMCTSRGAGDSSVEEMPEDTEAGSEFVSPQGNDFINNEKMYRRNEWKSRKKNSTKDDVRREHYLEAQEKRKQERRRSQGRKLKAALEAVKDLKPEGDDVNLHDDLSDFSFIRRDEAMEAWSRKQSMFSGIQSTSEEVLSGLLERFTDHEEMPIDTIVSACVKLFGFLGPLCTCKSKREVAQIVVATLSQHVSPSMIATIRNYMNSSDVLVPEDGDFNVESILTGFRDSVVQVRFLPMTKAIVSTMMLMVVSGMRPSSMMNESKLSDVMQVWEAKVIDTLSFKNMTECVAEIFEFAVQVVKALKEGESLKRLVLPNTLHKQYAALLPMKDYMYDNALEEKFGVTCQSLHATALDLLDNLEYALKKSKSPQERTIYTRYVVDVRKFAKDVEDYLRNHQFRREPFMISLYGGSGLGKSSIVQMLINTYCAAIGEEIPDSRIAYVKGIAKYDDNVTNATEIVVADDVCNIMPSEQERTTSFLAKIIEIGNNTPSLTNQAELSMKGRHYWMPGLVMATTNVANLMAPEISNKPISLVRRLHHVEIKVMDKYKHPGSEAIDINKVAHVTSSKGDIIAPMHMVQWFHFEEIGHNKQLRRVDDGPPVPINEFMTQFAKMVIDKKQKQKKYIDALRVMRECEQCPICFTPKAPGWCKHYIEATPEAGDVIAYLATSGTHQFLYWITNTVTMWDVPSYFPALESFLAMTVLSIVAFFVGRSRLEFGRSELKGLAYGLLFVFVLSALFVLTLAFLPFKLFLFIWPGIWIAMVILTSVGVARVVTENVIADLRSRIRPGGDVNPVLRATRVLGLVLVAVRLFTLLKGFMGNNKLKEQGNLNPSSMAEIEARNAEKSEWDKPTIQRATPIGRLMTMTRDQAIHRLASSVWRFNIKNNGYSSNGTVFFVSSQIFIIAEHSLKKILKYMDLDTTTFSFMKSIDQLGQQFSSHYVSHTPIKIDGEDSDHVLVKINSGPTMPNIVDFFPDHRDHRCMFSMIFRDENGSLTMPSGKYNKCRPKVNGLCGVWPGSQHTLSSPSESGNCSSPAVSWDKPHVIVGLHSAGSANGKHQVMYTPIRSEVEKAIDDLRIAETGMQAEGVDVYPLGLTSDPDLAPFGEQKAYLLDEAHERACVNWCPENGSTLTTFFGEVPNSRITPSSQIRDSIMKPVLKELGVDVNYGPPKFQSDRTHSFCLNMRRTAMKPIPPKILAMAVRDYLEPILDKIRDIDYRDGGFITLDQVLNGIRGARFIGPINERTSSGFGLKGAKDRYLDIEYDKKDNGRKIFYPHPEITERFHQMMARYAKGETCGSILRSALKDEAVKYDPETNAPKKEDRIFMSCGMVDVFCQKSMMAKVMQCMQSFPMLTEMAVGINSTTDEWDQIYEHVLKWSPRMVLAGDYSKYDLRLSGQLIRAAGYIMMCIAKAIGYSTSELRAMEAMMQELSNNYRIFGGCLISPDGYMPSGIYSTLAKNCIANALLHRCAYYDATGGLAGSYVFPRYSKENNFRDHVKMIFQGDDSLGSSRTSKYSMMTVKRFCDKYQMAYTTGDKKETIIPYISAEDAEFCKRGFYLHPKVGKRVGNLDVNSLIKSVCTYTKSVTSEETVLCETIDANLRELARHPPEVFDKYRRIFDEALTKLGLRHSCKYIDRSYDEWWEILIKVYRGEIVEEWTPHSWSLDTLLDDEFP